MHFFDKKTGAKGYFTIEASFIVLWTFLIIVWLMYYAFFLYDKCILFQDNYRIAAQTAAQIMPIGKKENWLNGHINESLRNEFMLSKDMTMNGSVNKNEINMQASLSVNNPFSVIDNIIPSKRWVINDRVEIKNYSYVQRIRKFRVIGRLIEDKDGN